VIDLAVMPDLRAQYGFSGQDELVFRPQYARRFVTVSRSRRKLELAAFVAADHVLVSPSGEEGGYVDDALRALGRQRRVAVTVPGFLAALTLVQSTDLLATLPEDVVRVVAPTLFRHTCPVDTPVLQMCLIWAARFTPDSRHTWLRTLVRDVLHARVGKALARSAPGKA
jgi:DNA-binding transcriptional LysR family regulator